MSKILSIIVPTYNMEKYLHKCLDSLIVSEENMALLEVLVVNDGSKDLSSQIAHEYEAKYPQTFKVIDKENGNYGSCINRGLKEITGKYVKILDADDSYVADALNDFISYLYNKDVDLIFNDFVKVDESDVITESYTFDLPTDRDFTLQDIPMGMSDYFFHHSITYRVEILRSINYHQTEGIPYTDDEWVFMPMYIVSNVSYFPYVLYNYFRGRIGQTFDINVLRSAFNKRIAIGKSMTEFFISIEKKCPDTTKAFVEEKLLKKLLGFYNFYLIKAYSQESNECLREFDLFIQNRSLSIYTKIGLAKDRIFKKKYIKDWRTSNYTITMYLRLRQFIYKADTIIGGIVHDNHRFPNKFRRKFT